jgi:epoxyqueuosine reductase
MSDQASAVSQKLSAISSHPSASQPLRASDDDGISAGSVSRPGSLSARLKHEALALGFVACGIASAEPDLDARRSFEERIVAGDYAGLPWFTVERARRCTDPSLVLSGARSILTLAAPTERRGPPAGDGVLRGRVARYAWGRDYHGVIEKKLRQIAQFLASEAPGSRSRVLVDYGPLAERAYAARAGIGWFGKSTNLLLPGAGSWVLLAEVLTTVALEPDLPLRKTCGACTRCVDACPTGAIEGGYRVNNERCVSYQTIENRGPIPRELRPLIGDWLFGCDICQEVCPVGAHVSQEPLPELLPTDREAAAPMLIPLLSLTDEQFRQRFAGRAVMRAKRDGLLRNACVVLGNLGDLEAVPALIRALDDTSTLVRGHAAWALGRIGGEAACAALASALAAEAEPEVREEIAAALAEQNDAPHSVRRGLGQAPM